MRARPRNSARHRLCMATFFALLGVLASTPAQASAHDADMYAVYFRSDRCPNCIILDPELAEARSATSQLPIRHITLDLDASASEYDEAMFALIDRGMADLYNAYLGLTGVVFLIDPGTGLPVDCLTRRQNASGLADRLESALVQTQQSDQVLDPDVIGRLCPPPLRRLPDGRMFGAR